MISTPQSEHFQLPLTVSRGLKPLSESKAILFVLLKKLSDLETLSRYTLFRTLFLKTTLSYFDLSSAPNHTPFINNVKRQAKRSVDIKDKQVKLKIAERKVAFYQ